MAGPVHEHKTRRAEGRRASLRGWALAALAGLALTALGAPGAEAQRRGAQAPAAIDLATPEGALAAQRRIWCTETDNEPVYWIFRGDAYSRRAGEADRLLFRVEGLNVRTCVRVTDPQRGAGFRSVSRELLLYLDPQTGQPLARWANPFTGETVDVLHVANDPVNGEFFLNDRSGQPTRWRGTTVGGQWFLTTTVPLFYPNPLAGRFQAEIGGTYHATEMFNFMGDLSDLTDRRSNNAASVRVGWVRIADWLPWMKMGGREGFVYMHAAGTKSLNWQDVPAVMQAEVARHYPAYRTPPPGDDRRPNETSWTYFLKVRDGQIQAPVRN